MIMKRVIEFCINVTLKNELELLFGEGSQVVVNFIRYSTNDKSIVIDCKLLTTDPELCKDTFPDGLNHLVLESWQYIGHKGKITLSHSMDIK
jgi:hypothetical protein